MVLSATLFASGLSVTTTHAKVASVARVARHAASPPISLSEAFNVARQVHRALINRQGARGYAVSDDNVGPCGRTSRSAFKCDDFIAREIDGRPLTCTGIIKVLKVRTNTNDYIAGNLMGHAAMRVEMDVASLRGLGTPPGRQFPC